MSRHLRIEFVRTADTHRVNAIAIDAVGQFCISHGISWRNISRGVTLNALRRLIQARPRYPRIRDKFIKFKARRSSRCGYRNDDGAQAFKCVIRGGYLSLSRPRFVSRPDFPCATHSEDRKNAEFFANKIIASASSYFTSQKSVVKMLKLVL